MIRGYARVSTDGRYRDLWGDRFGMLKVGEQKIAPRSEAIRRMIETALAAPKRSRSK